MRPKVVKLTKEVKLLEENNVCFINVIYLFIERSEKE